MAGNANSGRRKQSYITDALLVEIKAREKGGDLRGLRKMAVSIMDLAEGGERWAAEFVRDTVDGKPMQQVSLGGDPDAAPIMHEIVQRIVDTHKP